MAYEYIYNINWLCVTCGHQWFAHYEISEDEFNNLEVICPKCGSDDIDL